MTTNGSSPDETPEWATDCFAALIGDTRLRFLNLAEMQTMLRALDVLRKTHGAVPASPEVEAVEVD